jgi:release factor glutamine methyltransferase
VNSAVLVPRPETELLVESALERMRSVLRPRVLDLGTGSGCIAISLALECPGARVTAVDCSAAALEVARRNAARLGADVDFRLGDWYAACPSGAVFDLIVSNPPYVDPSDPHLDDLRFEPRVALTDGRDGLACLASVVSGASRHLDRDGWLLVEHGYDQAAAVQDLFARSGFAPATCSDAAGHPRVTVGALRQAPV